MSDAWRDLVTAYQHRIVDAGKEGEFLVLASFLLTFVVIRAVTLAIRRGYGRFRNVHVAGHHVHHLVPGILILLITGYLAIAVDTQVARRTTAILFGVGAALTLDEFALWLHLEDVYWERRGRRSVDAVLIAAAVGGLILVGPRFFEDAIQTVGRLFTG